MHRARLTWILHLISTTVFQPPALSSVSSLVSFSLSATRRSRRYTTFGKAGVGPSRSCLCSDGRLNLESTASIVRTTMYNASFPEKSKINSSEEEEEETIMHPSSSSPLPVAAIDTTIEKVSETLCGLLGVSLSEHVTKQTMVEALHILNNVVDEDATTTASAPFPSEDEHFHHDLSTSATKAAYKLCQIASSSTQNKKQTWQALQDAAGSFHGQGGDNTGEGAPAVVVSESNALAVSLVFGALSLWPIADPDGGSKAAASAMASTISRNKPLRHVGRPLASDLLRTYLTHAINSDTLQLQILIHFAKAFKLGDDCIDPILTARVVQNAIRPGVDSSWITPSPNGDVDTEGDPYKQKVSGALAFACQLQPWSVLSPVGLVDEAIFLDLWHAAEDACRSAHKGARSSSPSPPSSNSTTTLTDDLVFFSCSQQEENARVAVQRLIDAALEERMFRRADSLATNLYEMGGQSRYVEARFYHACETISKVVSRRQIAIVDRQIERVDKAVAKATLNAQKVTAISSAKTTSPSDATDTDCDESSRLIFDPPTEIRKFALEKLEEAGEITAAQRLASVFGIDYVHDELALMLATALRRKKYLQYEDVLRGSIPTLIACPEDLRLGFAGLLEAPHHHGPFGFDAEWDEDTIGAAVLQLATANRALLLDIPALSSTEEGVIALEETVGRLLSCSESVVAGFACRQDLARLRASPWAGSGDGMNKKKHWMRGTQAVIDVQNLVGKAEPGLVKAGLSRVCQFYFSKPLDKAEQCSLWSARPLSDNQRAYAALDAWVCVEIYNKVGSSANKQS